MRPHLLLAAACIAAALACAVNPVTGRRELVLVSESQEIAIGSDAYAPTRQSQGGNYVLDPELSAYVESIGRRLAAVSDRPELPYEFAVLNSSVPNAWALPGGKIALNRGLLVELENEAQLAAVLAHEIVHAAARHGATSVERGLLLQTARVGVAIGMGDSEWTPLVVGGAGLGAALVAQRYGRGAELESDRIGMIYMQRAGYDPRAAVELQEIFVWLSEGRRQNWLSGLFASHPPSPERVVANRETAGDLDPGGERARERYQRRIAGLAKTRELYAAYDEGRAALAQQQLDVALDAAVQALAAEPREARFHALRGDVRFAQRNYRHAIVNYDRAVERDPNFFYFYLRRGLAKRALRDARGAHADLLRSNDLLPTAAANQALGEISEATGEVDLAIAYYRRVAEGESQAAARARLALARLELPKNPGAYLSVVKGVDKRGYLVLEIENHAPFSVTGVAVEIAAPNAFGQVQRSTAHLRHSVPTRQRTVLRTGIGPIDNPEQLAAVRAEVIRARTEEGLP